MTRRAIVLEDSHTCRTTAHKTLQRLGYSVVAVRSVRAARGAVECPSPFDVALVDCAVVADERSETPCDGIIFAAELRHRWPNMIVIMWSVSNRSAEAAQIGATFLPKGAAVAERLRSVVLQLSARKKGS